MRTIFNFIFLIPLIQLSCNQESDYELKKLYSEYLLRQSKIDLIQYRVNRIDTFPDGNVWNNKGTATLERNNSDSIFRFSFFGKRDDLDRENIYVENKHFQIYPIKQTYRIENNYGIHVLGAAGGQMVVEDLLNPDTTNSTIDIEDKDDLSFLIIEKRFVESAIITKYLTISKSSFFPIKIRKTVKDTLTNLNYSSTFNITDILIGDQVKNNDLKKITLLASYKEESPAINQNADALIGQVIPELVLRTFSNQELKLKSFNNKVVLLDFWELWCGPCINSLPKINELSKKYKSSDFIAIGITTSKIEDVKRYLSANGIDFEQASSNSKLSNFFKVNSFPRYVVIDKKGIIRFIYYGFSEDLESKIISLF